MSAEKKPSTPGPAPAEPSKARRRLAPRRRRGVRPVLPVPARAAPARRYPLVLGLGGLLLLLSLGLWWMLAHQAPGSVAASVPAPLPPKPAVLAKPAALIESASLEQLLATHGQPADWRVARLLGNEAVLVIEFPNLREQGLAFNRAAAFIEKKHSSRDHVLNDTELAALLTRAGDTVETFYYGHDYTGPQLKQYFERAQAQGIALNAQEQRLHGVLLAAALWQRSGHQQAVISFSAQQADDPATPADEGVDALRRESTLRHELSHGEFFTRPAYQKRSWRFWRDDLSKAERAMFRRMLAGMDYDPDNEELMANETQAILMHTPDTRAFDAGNLGVTPAQLQELRARFERSR